MIEENDRSGSRAEQEVPQGWMRVRLLELCYEDRRIVEPNTPVAQSLPYMGLEHVEADTGRVLLDAPLADAVAGQSITFRFDRRHVLYGKLRPYLNKVALPTFDGRCTTELIPLLPRDTVPRELIALLLRRPQTVKAAMIGVTGSRMPRANLQEVLNQEVCIPASRVQRESLTFAISARLAETHRAKRKCEEQLNLLRAYEQRLIEHMESFKPDRS